MKPEWMVNQRDKDRYWLGVLIGSLLGLSFLYVDIKYHIFIFPVSIVGVIIGISVLMLYFTGIFWYYNLIKDIQQFNNKVKNFNVYCRKNQWIY